MGIELTHEQPYHPAGGMNIDSNGISTRANECIDAVNVDISSSMVKRRKGTEALAAQGSGIGPVLKYHRYLHPTLGSILFAFCATNIYKYEFTGWTSVHFGTAFSVDTWSITDTIDKDYGATVVAAGSNYSDPNSPYADATSRVLFVYDGSTWYTIAGLSSEGGDQGMVFLPDYTLSSTSDLVIEFEITPGVSNEGYIGGYATSAPLRYLYIRYEGAGVLSLTSGTDIVANTIEVVIEESVRYIARVNAAGDAWLDGVSLGSTGGTIVGTSTEPAMLFGLYKYGGEATCYIYSATLDGDKYAVNQTGEYFYELADPTNIIFAQKNSIFPSESSWNSHASGNPGEYYFLNAGDTAAPIAGIPTDVSHDTSAVFLSYIFAAMMTYVAPGGGALSAGQWTWDDKNALGYDTLYMRASDDSDPISTYRTRVYDATFIDETYNDYLSVDVTGEIQEVAFVDLDIKKNLYADELYDATSGPGSTDETIVAPSVVPAQDWELTADRAIVPGTAYLVAGTIGVIATASLKIYDKEFGTTPNLEEIEVNYWLPVDETEIAFGSDSYIRLDTGAFSAVFLTDRYDGEELTIYYQYETAVDYKPLHVTNYHSALILSNTAEYFITDTGTPSGEWVYTPWRTRWSEQGNIKLFRESNYQDLSIFDISPILAVKPLETAASSNISGPLYFYKHNNIVRGTYNQNYNLDRDLPVPMLSFELALSEGIEAAQTITSFEGVHVFLGRNDIYAFDGVRKISLTEDKQTGNTRIQRYIFDNLDLDALNQCFSVYDDINRKCYFFVKLTSNTGTYPTDCFVYDLDMRQWVRHTYSEVSAAISLDFTPGGAIDSLDGSIDSLNDADPTLTIDELTSNLSKMLVFGIGLYSYYAVDTPLDEIGQNNTEFSSYLITRDFLGQSLADMDRVQRMYVEGRDGTIEVSHSCCYELDVDTYDFPVDLPFGAKYSREAYDPDTVTTAIRFALSLEDKALFRWLQVFSSRQEFTNE